MSNCSNCYGGCTEIVSDRCVKYTGIDVPVLGIQTGDSLSFVEQALITFLTSTLDGTGIKIDLGNTVICTLIQEYLPTCGDLTIVDVSKALIDAACSLQTQVNTINNTLTTLNADYTLPANCLTGVTASSDTHAIVQAVINKLCSINADFIQLLIDLPNTYVAIADIDTLIQNYLNSQNFLSLAKDRMIPYAPIPYFGPLSNYPASGDNFSISGVGSGYWDKVYLCNGANPGVPDLRGRTLVGATTGMGGGTFNSAVNPAISGNPNYALNTLVGLNQVVLTTPNLPSHTHTATVTQTPHTHQVGPTGQGILGPLAASTTTVKFDNANSNDTPLQSTFATEPANANISVANNSTGDNAPHLNIQPSIGCYYIMYIP
jgi:microcystin-dependent protein